MLQEKRMAEVHVQSWNIPSALKNRIAVYDHFIKFPETVSNCYLFFGYMLNMFPLKNKQNKFARSLCGLCPLEIWRFSLPRNSFSLPRWTSLTTPKALVELCVAPPPEFPERGGTVEVTGVLLVVFCPVELRKGVGGLCILVCFIDFLIV